MASSDSPESPAHRALAHPGFANRLCQSIVAGAVPVPAEVLSGRVAADTALCSCRPPDGQARPVYALPRVADASSGPRTAKLSDSDTPSGVEIIAILVILAAVGSAWCTTVCAQPVRN